MGANVSRRPGTWSRLRALARRWPKPYRFGHEAAILVWPLLVASGLALYLPRFHAPLIPYFPFIYWGHVVLGLGAAALLLLPLFVPVDRRLLHGLDWAAVLVLGGGLTITGVLMWLVGAFPAAWRANAFFLHGLLAAAAVAWLAWHAYRQIARAARPARRTGHEGARAFRPSPARRLIARREFLTWAAGGLGAAFAATLLGGPVIRLWQEIGRGPAPRPAGGPAAGAAPRLGWPGFQLYTVVPGYPDIDPARWTLSVDGLVAAPAQWSFDEFRALPATTIVRNFQCVTGWAVPNCRWQGVPLKEVLARVRPTAEARFVTLYSGDGVYTESLSLDQAQLDDVLLAYALNGEPLPRAQGAPCRLVVPEMYGYKSIKWVVRIEVVAERQLGFWEVRGYEADAWLPASTPGPAGRG